MILDRIGSHAAGSEPARDLSRRRFLQAGAAAGGGLMLSLRLPHFVEQAGASAADGFAPNAFIRVGATGRLC